MNEPAINGMTRTLARAAGWASLGAAALAFVAPAALSRTLGYGQNLTVVRVLGMRDLVVGLGLVAADDLTPWLKARFACEIADTALHTAGALTGEFDRGRATTIAFGAAGIAAIEYVLFLRRKA